MGRAQSRQLALAAPGLRSERAETVTAAVALADLTGRDGLSSLDDWDPIAHELTPLTGTEPPANRGAMVWACAKAAHEHPERVCAVLIGEQKLDELARRGARPEQLDEPSWFLFFQNGLPALPESMKPGSLRGRLAERLPALIAN